MKEKDRELLSSSSSTDVDQGAAVTGFSRDRITESHVQEGGATGCEILVKEYSDDDEHDDDGISRTRRFRRCWHCDMD